jgi:cysteine-rich repeat protein
MGLGLAVMLADAASGQCGSSQLDPGEQCDDGNTEDGDTCRGDCGQDYTPCGNGQLDPGEQCDDGNVDSGDGCSAVCQETQCEYCQDRCPGNPGC